jgi:hypothetical protein
VRKPFLQSLGTLARVLALVGLVAVSTGGGCDWFNSPSAANVPPERVVVDCPSEGIVAGEDLEITWRPGRDPDGQVVEYVWTYACADSSSSGRTSATSTVIASVAAGADTVTVAAVDDDGDVGDPGVCVFVASEPGGLVGRVVLAEFVSGLGCPNCPNARGGLEIVLGEYGRDSLAVVAYYSQPHPLGPQEVYDLLEGYFGTPSPDGLPIVFIDHAGESLIGATSPEAAADRYRERIDERRALGSPLTIGVTGGFASGEVAVTVRVEDPLTGGPYVVRTMLVEDNIFLYNENHMFVVRDILEDQPLGISAVGESALIERDFTVDPGWDTEEMDIIAFVQDQTTFEIVQAKRLKTE